jgi:hypothetical protein
MEQHGPVERHLVFQGPQGYISHSTETFANYYSRDARFKYRHVDRFSVIVIL